MVTSFLFNDSFRDLLHDKYRSSTRAKAERRKISNLEAKEKLSKSVPTSRTTSPRDGQVTKPPSIASCSLRHRSDSQLVADLLHEKRKSFDQTFNMIMRQCSVGQQELQHRHPPLFVESQVGIHHNQNQLERIESQQQHHQEYESCSSDRQMDALDQHQYQPPQYQMHPVYCTSNNYNCNDREDESTDGYEHLELECKK
jgi:hypothetical protein